MENEHTRAFFLYAPFLGIHAFVRWWHCLSIAAGDKLGWWPSGLGLRGY